MSQLENIFAPSPAAAELELLAVIWRAEAEADSDKSPRAFRLSKLHELLKQFRELRKVDFGEPKLSTVSTCLRSMKEKGLLEEVRLLPDGSIETSPAHAAGLMRSTRSPHTAYRSTYTPKDILGPMFRDIASAYPDAKRNEILVDLSEHLSETDRMEAFIALGISMGISESALRTCTKKRS